MRMPTEPPDPWRKQNTTNQTRAIANVRPTPTTSPAALDAAFSAVSPGSVVAAVTP